MGLLGAKCQTTHYAYVIVLTSMLTALGALGFGRFSYTIILPPMKHSLNINYEQAGLLGSANSIGYISLSLIGGLLAAKYGSRKVISFSMIILGLALAATGLAPDFPIALVAQLFAGIGSGGSYIPAIALVSAWFTSDKRGLASGIITGGIGLGLVISGVVLPGITNMDSAFGWRYAWCFVGGLAVLFGIVGYTFLRDRPEEMGLMPYGASLAERDPIQAPQQPSVSLNNIKAIYGMSAFWHLSFVYFLFGFSYVLYTTYFSAHLTSGGRLSGVEAGNLWALVGVVSVVSGSIWGKASDLWGRKLGLALVFFVQAICYTIFATVPNKFAFDVSAVLFGLTAWSIPAIIAAAGGDYGEAKLVSVVVGSLTVFSGAGQSVSPFIGGWIADITASIAPVLLLAAVVAAIGGLVSLTLDLPKNGIEVSLQEVNRISHRKGLA